MSQEVLARVVVMIFYNNVNPTPIRQSLIGLLLGTCHQAGRNFIPSNGPRSDCEMQLAPDYFSFLKSSVIKIIIARTESFP